LEQSTCYRHEARQVIAEAVNAKISGRAAVDVVVFTGNGTTSAVDKLVHSLDLHLPLPDDVNADMIPVVFTSSYEHHSNLLPWRESVADVVTVRYSTLTGICLVDLQEKLQHYANRKIKIGAFSAASNVTGILTDVDAVSVAMHRAGGIVVFDYATAAPYVKIDMNPVIMGEDAQYAYKDAIFFSGHKFIGGPGSPGVLIAKKKLLAPTTLKPTVSGGGTVFYVTEHHHRYLSNRSEREEGGTPNIVGDIRLGLVVHLKQTIGVSWIEAEERSISSRLQARFQRHPRIVLLGRTVETTELPQSVHNHLPIFSFLIRAGRRFLHHNFVCALLNDLFGVQTRGGCQCAGPFSQSILGLSDRDIQLIEAALLDKHEVIRPGFSRLSVPFWLKPAEVDYIASAVEFVADHGYLFVPFYRYNPKTGEWAHTTRLTRFPERKWLSYFQVRSSGASDSPRVAPTEASGLKSWGCDTESGLFDLVLKDVQQELAKVKKLFERKRFGNLVESDSDLATLEDIRWFFNVSDIKAVDSQGNAESELPLGRSDFDALSHRCAHHEWLVCIGPIQPHLWSADSTETKAIVSSNGSIESAYARKRDGVLPARSGGERFANKAPPRYVSFASEASAVPLVTSTARAVDPSEPMEVDNNESSADPVRAAAAAVKVVVSTGAAAAPRVSLLAVKPGAAVISTPAPVDTSEKKPASNCDDGTCKPAGPGKILSGPGLLFAADTAVPFAGKVHLPPKKIMKLVGQAIRDWNMIEEGDKLLLGLSGGKDSLALLHILLTLQKRSPVKFSIACATVDPQTESFDPSPLIPYVQSLNVPYHFLSEPIVELAKTKMQGDSLCAFCARFKRGLLYSCCRTNGYNKLVLAQHLDDLAESFIMSALHNGQVRTLKANYGIEAGDVKVIRPLVYVREVETRNFSVSVHLPIINENCPACFEKPKERHRVKKLLQQEEAMVPDMFCNLRKALQPLMDDGVYDAMKLVNNQIADRNNNRRRQLPNQSAKLRDIDAEEDGTDAPNKKRMKVDTVKELTSADEFNIAPSEKADICTSDFCAPCFELA
jgi:selenocysteine lyase/cysteine desulfurase/tRNA(Ile)-lysidine synthase TilS/MesJ